ncbi:phosphatase PAP2 family protein [Halovulum sp. GXIMD14793]
MFQMLRLRLAAVVLGLLLVLGTGGQVRAEKSSEIVGDYLQIALPVAGLVCSFGKEAVTDYFARFWAHWAVVHGFKNGLGEAEPNLRPHGGDRGFPSGHTAAAFYGASYLARECVSRSPLGQLAVWGGAMYTGGSRIEAGAHFLFQVVFGALVGIGADRLFGRRRLRDSKRLHLWRKTWRPLNWLRSRRLP